MPAKRTTDSRIVGYMFRGWTTRAVSEKIGVSASKVSECNRGFLARAVGVGLLVAAGEYGVEKQVRELIEIGKVTDAAGLEPAKVRAGLGAYSALERLGFEPEEAGEFLEASVKECRRQNILPGEFVSLAKALAGLGAPGEADYRRTIAEAKQARVDLDELRREVSGLEERRGKLLEGYGSTEGDLKRFRELRERMRPLGLDLGDAERAATYLENIKESGSEPEALVSLLSRDVGVRRRIEGEEARGERLRADNEKATKELGELDNVLTARRELAERVGEAKSLGLAPQAIGVVVGAVSRLGSAQGLTLEASIARLGKDLEEHWGPALSFENQMVSAKARMDVITEQVALAEEKRDAVEESVRAKSEALQGLEELNTQVSNAELIEFKKLIVDGGTDVENFRAQVERLGGIRAYVDSEKAKGDAAIAELRGSEASLKARVEVLTMEEAGLKSTIETQRSKALTDIVSGLKRVEEASTRLLKNFEDPNTGVKAIYLKATDENVEAKGTLQNSIAMIEKLNDTIKNTTMLYSFHGDFEHLATMMRQEDVDLFDALKTMRTALIVFSNTLKKYEMGDLSSRMLALAEVVEAHIH